MSMFSTLGAISPAFVLIEAINYLLTVVVLIHAWRREPSLAWLMVTGIVMGYLVELSQTTHEPPPYYYTEALVFLPGRVPLGVVLSWGIIFFSLFNVLRAIAAPIWLAPMVAGLMAVGLDLVTDPSFVALGFWVWNEPSGWFGIPWVNYVGWFVIVTGFFATWNFCQKHIKPDEKNFFWDLVRSVVTLGVAFGAFVGIMLAYVELFQVWKLVPEQIVAGGLFAVVGAIVIWHMPGFKRDTPVSAWVLVTPIFLLSTSLLILLFSKLHITSEELMIVSPAMAALVLGLYLWPSLDKILGITSDHPHPLPSGRKCFWIATIASLAFVLLAYQTLFAPKKDLIGPIELPADDAFLPSQPVQWWYWTGHLKTKATAEEPSREFGFEVVFFTFDTLIIMRDQLVQAAVTDIKNNSFHFNEHIVFSLPNKIPNGFNMTSGSKNTVTAVGGNGHDVLHAQVDGYTLDLKLDSTKEPVLHYGGDAHPYRAGGFTYYYSREHMATTGTIKVNGKTYEVEGFSWFDRQYGDLLRIITKGWQWFAIELDDNRQIMVYDILGKSNEVEQTASVTDASGKTRVIPRQDFTVKILGKWKSPHTKCVYPSGWEVTIEGETFTVMPQVLDQELRVKHGFWAGPEYWEGTNTVTGPVNGRAYVELNGFCRGPEGTIKF
jgi:predicted secreted hydrolase/uncharacterized membrane protein